ncbi:hypothetical protein [Hyphobacterium sp.]|uniref:hypothetical protein n=1 Tax=Hyphobacterium sp. TaxID=2004662 RepID=UPI003BAD77BC
MFDDIPEIDQAMICEFLDIVIERERAVFESPIVYVTGFGEEYDQADYSYLQHCEIPSHARLSMLGGRVVRDDIPFEFGYLRMGLPQISDENPQEISIGYRTARQYLSDATGDQRFLYQYGIGMRFRYVGSDWVPVFCRSIPEAPNTLWRNCLTTAERAYAERITAED